MINCAGKATRQICTFSVGILVVLSGVSYKQITFIRSDKMDNFK